MAKFYI